MFTHLSHLPIKASHWLVERTGAYWPQFTVLRETDLVRIRVRGSVCSFTSSFETLCFVPLLIGQSWSTEPSLFAVPRCLLPGRGWGWAVVARKAEFQFLPNRQSLPAFGASGLSTVILPRTDGKNQCPPLAFWIASVPSQHTLRVAAPARQLSFF